MKRHFDDELKSKIEKSAWELDLRYLRETLAALKRKGQADYYTEFVFTFFINRAKSKIGDFPVNTRFVTQRELIPPFERLIDRLR